MNANSFYITTIEDHIGRYSEKKNYTQALNRKEDISLQKKLMQINIEKKQLIANFNKCKRSLGKSIKLSTFH